MSEESGDPLSGNLADVFEQIVFCAKIGGHEAARGKKGNKTILHDMIDSIGKLKKQCEVLEKEKNNE